MEPQSDVHVRENKLGGTELWMRTFQHRREHGNPGFFRTEQHALVREVVFRIGISTNEQKAADTAGKIPKRDGEEFVPVLSSKDMAGAAAASLRFHVFPAGDLFRIETRINLFAVARPKESAGFFVPVQSRCVGADSALKHAECRCFSFDVCLLAFLPEFGDPLFGFNIVFGVQHERFIVEQGLIELISHCKFT